MTELNDPAAIQTLTAIAKGRLATTSEAPTLDPSLRAALAAAFGSPAGQPATEGELARAAVDVLAEDPAYAEPIAVISLLADRSPLNHRYLDPGTITVAAAALLVLQTRVKWKRDSTGKWSIEIEKKSLSDATLKLLIERLLSLSGK